MTTIFRRIGATIGSMALLSLGGVANAQESADSVDTGVSTAATYHPGDGLKLSDDLLVHPRVDLDGGYQNNVFYADDKDEGGQQGSPFMRVGVGAALSTDTASAEQPRLVLTGDAEILWNQYINSDDNITNRSDMGISASAEARVNPAGAVGFTLRDQYVRAVNPPPAEFSEDADRDRNELAATVSFRPGGGALEIYGGAKWAVDVYESDVFAFAARNLIDFTVGSKWQWLPKTQLNGDVTLGLVFIDKDAIRIDHDTATPLRAMVGISTLITPNFGTVLRAGYGNSFQSGAEFNSYLALAEARYAFGPTVKLAAGYSHDFADSVIGNFRTDHSLFARFAALVAGQLELTLKAEIRFRDYEGIPHMSGQLTFCNDLACSVDKTNRADTVFRFSPAATYQINAWLSIGARYSLISNTTDAYIVNGASRDSFGFVWNEFMVTARAQF